MHGAGGGPRRVFGRQSSFVDGQQGSVTEDAQNVQRNKTAKKTPAKVVPPRQTKKDPTTLKKEKPLYDELATKKFDKMLRGDLNDLPPFPKSTVKIFLSSTFSDMRAERNTLAREVYPRLQTYCQSRDLDFQAVDMRWGVTEDSINDHSVENLCLLEIENCQKTSFGPNFVVLSGDRYGFRPIPVSLDVRTFDIIRHEANKLNLPNKALLDQWYKLDENVVPATYILQPIRSQFTFYGDFSPGCDELRERDTTNWWSTFEKLQILLRKAGEEANEENKLTAKEKHLFFQSVTESEIQDGILNASDVDSHCLVYKRTLRHLTGVGINDKDTPRYIDVIKSEKGNILDEEVESLKTSLFEGKICKKLNQTNIKQYSIHWMPGGVNPDNLEEHNDYLNSFCQHFISDCKSLIQKAEEEKKKKMIPLSNYYTDYNSTIHHLRFCVSKCESFCGQDKVLDVAKSYILDKSGRKPLVLYAPSGVGKTSIMAKIMESIPNWLKNGQHLKLIRFLGTSPQCYNVYDVLRDVIGHLADVYDIIMSPPSYKTMKKIVEFTPRFLRQVANIAKEPIVILLDSLDQLEPRNNAYAMDWLPLDLPLNVKLIVSSLPTDHNILTNLRKRLPDQTCYFEIPALVEETARKIVETNLKAQNRTLSRSQESYFWTIFEPTHSPLFLQLLIDEAKKWKSYTPKSEIELVSTVKEAINKHFRNLENKFGNILVSHALGFITVGMTGLTEYEIDDALSCDDEVLNEVYKFHDPPVQGIVQIPPLLWARIWYDIRGYLVERISYGKSTLNWFHREFVSVATERYASGDSKSYLNLKLLEIFLQVNGIKRTIVLENRDNLQIIDADRQITPQPYKADNKRKLACLPYHSLRSFQTTGLETVKRNIYCNFKYLCSKIAAFSVASVVNDLSDFIEASNDEEVRLLYNFFVNCKQDLSIQSRFAICLLAYVYPEENQYQLRELRNEAVVFLEYLNRSGLIPEFPCLAQRKEASNAFQTSIQDVSAILAHSNSSILFRKGLSIEEKTQETEEFKMQPDIAIWSSETQEVTNLSTEVSAKPIGEHILTDENLYFITKQAFVRHSFSTCKSDTISFEEILPDWTGNQCVKGIVSNSEATTGALIHDNSIALVSLENFKFLQTYRTPNENFVIDNVFVLNDVQKLIATGKVLGTCDNKSFIFIFEQENQLPTHALEFAAQFDARNGVMSTKDRWLFIPSEIKDMNKQTDNENQGSGDFKLLAFDIGESSFEQKEINIVSPIKKISVHPDRGKVLFLTRNGKMFSMLVYEFSAQAVVLEMNLEFSIKNFLVYWEKEIGLFCSNGGQLVLYNLKADRVLLAFAAHSDKIRDICLLDHQLITIGEDNEMRSWAVKSLVEKSINVSKSTGDSTLKESFLEQSDVVSLSPSYEGDELLTVHDDGTVKIWNLDSQRLIHQFNIGLTAGTIIVFPDHLVSFLDTNLGQMKILDIKTGMEAIQLPDTIGHILTSIVDKTDNLYIVSAQRNGKEQIDIVNTGRRMVIKTIHLQSGMVYKRLEAVLSVNNRYLVFRLLMSEKQFSQVKELYHENFPWKKGGFTDQNHRYRFTAVALSEGSGALIPCNRIAAKVPTIGIHVQPYRGNVMLISTRRWIFFWDIPTGKYDKKPSKLRKVPMFHRLTWTGKESIGETKVLLLTPDQKFVVSGSDDGYVFVYNAETGLPVCNRKPLSKHNAEVRKVIVSPDSKWIVSSCNNCTIKLWDTATGTDQFSVRLDAGVKGMSFTPDSKRLLLFTGTHTSRLFVFRLTVGKKK